MACRIGINGFGRIGRMVMRRVSEQPGRSGCTSCECIEAPHTSDNVMQKLRWLSEAGRNHAPMVVAEGIRLPSDEVVTTSYADGEVRYRRVSCPNYHRRRQEL